MKYYETDKSNIGDSINAIKILINSGDYEEGLKRINEMFKQCPDHKILLCYKGIILFEQGKIDESIICFDKSLDYHINTKSNTDSIHYCRLFDVKNNDPIILNNNNNVILIFKGLEEELLNEDEFISIKTYLKKIIDKKIIDFRIFSNYGYILNIFNEYILATKYIDNALQINENHFRTLVHKSFNLQSLNKFKESLEYIDKALQIYNNNKDLQIYDNELDAINKKITIMFKLKMYNDIINFILKCLKKYPDNSSLFNDLGIVYQYLKKYKQAIVYYDKAIQYDQTHVCALINKALIFKQKNEYIKALKCYDRVLSLYPNNEEIITRKENLLNTLNKEQLENYIKEDQIVDEYEYEMPNSIKEFLSKHIIKTSITLKYYTTKSMIYNKYINYCKNNNLLVYPPTMFDVIMRKQKYENDIIFIKNISTEIWKNIKLI